MSNVPDDIPRTLMFELREENGYLLLATSDYLAAKASKRPTDYIAEAYYVRLETKERAR